MKVSYYPGCSLEGTARDYSDSIHEVCALLGIELEEVPDWNCCGATAAHSINHQASIELAGRNLKLASSAARERFAGSLPALFQPPEDRRQDTSERRQGALRSSA